MKDYIGIIFVAAVIFTLHFPTTHNTLQVPQEEIISTPSQQEMTQEEVPEIKQNSQEKKEETQSQQKESTIKKETSQQVSPSLKPQEKEEPKIVQEEPQPNENQYSLIQKNLFELMNQERQSPVSLYTPLLKSSTIRAKEASQKWSHTRLNNTRWDTTLSSIIDIEHILHGENLAKIQVTYQDSYSYEELQNIALLLHQGLVNSHTHYAVMTNPNYKKVNIGIYTSVDNQTLTIVVAQHYIE